MKLLERWKMLIGQSMALAPMLGSPLVDAGQTQLVSSDWLPASGNTPPAFKNTLNAKDAINIYAAHRSHSSHSSHRSHSSHYSSSGGYSAPRSYSTPSSPSYTPPSANQGSTYGQGLSAPRTAPPSSAYGTRPAAQDLSALVKRVQLALMVKKYYSGAIDGVMGNGTRGALMAFQSDSGIGIHGRMDTPTLNALGIAIP